MWSVGDEVFFLEKKDGAIKVRYGKVTRANDDRLVIAHNKQSFKRAVDFCFKTLKEARENT